MAARRGRSSRGRPAGRTSTNANIERLRQRFAEFHRRHPRRTRIPDPLRQAALALLEQGVSETELRRACGVSSKQLEQWRNAPGATQVHSTPASPDARVFSVVGDDSAQGVESVAPDPGDQLELRLDGWSIIVCRPAR